MVHLCLTTIIPSLLFLWSAGPGLNPRLALAAKLPKNLKRCALKEPTFNQCLRAAIEDALPKLKNGNSKIGLPSFNPLTVDKLELLQGNPQGPLTLKLLQSNVKIVGSLDGVKVHDAKFDSRTWTFETVTETPKVVIEADYAVNGRMLLLRIEGTGPSKTVMENIETKLFVQGKNVTRGDGKQYLQVEKASAQLKPKKMALNLDNLFNGDKQLGENMNRIVNENWQQVFNEIEKPLNEAYSQIFKKIVEQLFSRVQIHDVFIFDD